MANTNTNNMNVIAEETKAIRKTKRTYFEEILNMVSSEEHKAFLEKEIALLDKKRTAKKKSDRQIQNDLYAELILSELKKSGNPQTFTDLKSAIPEIADFSSQKISAIMQKLTKAGLVIRTRERGVSYFAAVVESEE